MPIVNPDFPLVAVAKPSRSVEQIKADVAEIVRKRFEGKDPLRHAFAAWVHAEHLEAANLAPEGAGRAHMQQYLDAKHGHNYNPLLPVRWPQAMTDGSRKELE